MTAQIEEHLVKSCTYRFFTEDCDRLVAFMKQDDEIIDAEFFYWFSGKERVAS
jgi:hypothetical protein